MNSLFSQLMGGRSNTGLFQMMNMCKNASDPNQFLADLLNQNPNAKEMFLAMKNSGKTPRDFFYQMASEKGVNPDTIINSIK